MRSLRKGKWLEERAVAHGVGGGGVLLQVWE